MAVGDPIDLDQAFGRSVADGLGLERLLLPRRGDTSSRVFFSRKRRCGKMQVSQDGALVSVDLVRQRCYSTQVFSKGFFNQLRPTKPPGKRKVARKTFFWMDLTLIQTQMPRLPDPCPICI